MYKDKTCVSAKLYKIPFDREDLYDDSICEFIMLKFKTG